MATEPNNNNNNNNGGEGGGGEGGEGNNNNNMNSRSLFGNSRWASSDFKHKIKGDFSFENWKLPGNTFDKLLSRDKILF